MGEPDRLLSVATAIAEGTSVSWSDEAQRAIFKDEGATLNALREFEQLLNALRGADRDDEPTPATAPAGDRASTVAPQRWGHLVILETIGRGSFATVYRAHDERLNTDVALKLLSSLGPAGRAQADRILKEAQLLASVRHANVVHVYGVDDRGEQVGLWMELVKGYTLTELLQTQGPFSAHEASMIGRDVCRAMAAVHQAGILHGDIKAHNIMRESGGRIVLMDFGAAQAIDDSHHPEVPLAGTPVYLAPELLARGPRSTSSDIYALGVLLYHLVTGSYPVGGPSLPDLIAAHARGERRHLRDARPDLPDDFVRTVERAIAHEPADRFKTLGQLEDALVRVMSPAPTIREDPPLPIPVRPRRSAGPLALAAGVVLLIALSALWLTSRHPKPDVADHHPDASLAQSSAVNGLYDIEAAFFRAGRSADERLGPDVRVAPGDELFLKLQASVPLHVYVVNEDEKGAAFLLFPMAGDGLVNPLPAGQPLTLPKSTRWQIDSPGEQEHFLVFASPEPLDSLQEEFKKLPTPKLGAPVRSASLPSSAVERLRSVGGLTPAPAAPNSRARLAPVFQAPLTDAREQAHGLWVRQLTVANPGTSDRVR
jgi:serine/threonine-protein kinase